MKTLKLTMLETFKENLKSHHLDKDTLLITNKVEGGCFDFYSTGYTYSFSLFSLPKNNCSLPVEESEYDVAILYSQNNLTLVWEYRLRILDVSFKHNKVICDIRAIRDLKLLRKNLDYFLNIYLWPLC